MATATDDNAEIRNLDARLFEKSTCWHTRFLFTEHISQLLQAPADAPDKKHNKHIY